MGVLPLQFKDGENAQSLGLTGEGDLRDHRPERRRCEGRTVVATPASGAPIKFEVRVRIDTPKEREYFQHGGILHYVLRQLASQSKAVESRRLRRQRQRLALLRRADVPVKLGIIIRAERAQKHGIRESRTRSGKSVND